MNVIVNGLLAHYRIQGNGPTILMLHGWGDRLETFDSLAGQLESGFQIVRLDLAGFGQSQAPDSTWGLEDYAEYVSEFTRKIKATPSIVLGHSNGGAIAIKAIATKRLSPQKLVLLASAGIRDGQAVKKKAWNVVAKVGKMTTALLPDGTRRSLRAKLYRSAGSDLMVAPHLESTFKRVVSQDVRPDARIVQLPTLIINGSEDTATPPDYGKMFNADIEGSELRIIDGAGHFIHQHNTAALAKYLEDFLR